ncbi:MAG: class I adenylate-forming enzyme family protein [Myxococcota bacterium]
MLVHSAGRGPLTLQPANRLCIRGEPTTLGSLRPPELPGEGPVAVVSDDVRVQLATAVALFNTGRRGLVLPSDRLTPRTEPILRSAGYSLVFTATGEVVWGSDLETKCGVALLTSGTTGPPKLYVHGWDSLSTHPAGLPPRHWLQTYSPGTYAWYQLVTLWMFAPSQALTLGPSDPIDRLEAAAQHGVNAISCTPSFWRYVFLGAPKGLFERLDLVQLTLGGERVDQEILNQLAKTFPQARISHIYASTEVGASLVVHDGREGFPATWVGQPRPGRPELRIEDGILYVRSPFAAEGTDRWHRTGDRVERKGDRMVIVGREDEGMLNVGGRKASRTHLEQTIGQHPDVVWCRVYTRRSPISGSVVAADVVPRHAVEDQEAFGESLALFCRGRDLADWSIPRFWNLKEQIPMGTNFKASR